ncbi:hypothetical protein [Solicola gregarius]|uniref:Uncharacterized protein n=1 Tax=Solicola gregarius TaxID=2908642 RepID=A0AA46YLL4_9ACTN|nr:hypothetical protein [Solicola gregarius]UYM06762.1 hypothetical protein L0C25_06730 [Solicola gregarius]
MASAVAAVAFTSQAASASATTGSPDDEHDWGVIGASSEHDWTVTGATGEHEWT